MGSRNKRSAGSVVFDICNYSFMFLLTLIFLYPLVYVLSVSMSSPMAISLGKVKLFPVDINFLAYDTVLKDSQIWLAYFNTIYYSIAGTLVTLLLTSITAYPLSLKSFYGRGPITIYFTITMFISGGMIPSYILIRNLGLMDTIWAIILPGALGVWNIVVIRTNFQGVPESLRESALIDGAGNWRILFAIIIPLSKPILVTIGMFTMVLQWNNFYAPLLYLSSPNKLTLQMLLRALIVNGTLRTPTMETQFANMKGVGTAGFIEAIKMTAIIISIGPIILVYPAAQRFFVKGVLVGSVKG